VTVRFSGAALRRRHRQNAAFLEPEEGGAQGFVQGDAQGLPFSDRSFEWCFCETIEHVPDP